MSDVRLEDVQVAVPVEVRGGQGKGVAVGAKRKLVRSLLAPFGELVPGRLRVVAVPDGVALLWKAPVCINCAAPEYMNPSELYVTPSGQIMFASDT